MSISFRISLRWLIHIINSVDKTKLIFITPFSYSLNILQRMPGIDR